MHHNTDYSEHIPVTPRTLKKTRHHFEKKNLFVERWEKAAEEQNAKDVPVHITTRAHDDEKADELYPKQ